MSVQPSQACHILVEHRTQRSQQDLFEWNLENNNHSIEHVFLLVR